MTPELYSTDSRRRPPAPSGARVSRGAPHAAHRREGAPEHARKPDAPEDLLDVTGLRVSFPVKGGGELRAVDGVDFSVRAGEIVGLVGETGSGKTVCSLSLLRLVAPPGRIVGGNIRWRGRDLLGLGAAEMRKLRGKEMAMIFQNPQSSLNPVYTVGAQLAAVIRQHKRSSAREAREEAVELLRLVRIPDAERRANDYPHQFSIGMCQRVMIAMAVACRPRLLIADEPTASLDVTVQAQIMDLLLDIRDTYGTAILLVSHDLGVIAQMCERVVVMYLGRVVESASAEQLYASPMHPYTQALLRSVPVPDPSRRGRAAKIEGDVPSLLDARPGCRFSPRCPEAFEPCALVDPQLVAVGDTHVAACLLYGAPYEPESPSFGEGG
jgi:oligopeptide/dipeptide ABC transporter ATP-binding protein